MRDFDLDAFEERSAIAEFCGGMTRFEAETLAAKAQGLARWQAMKLAAEGANANGRGLAGGGRDQVDQMGGQRNADGLPAVQRQPKEENRPVPEREPEAGRDRVALSPLRTFRGASA